LPRRKKDTGNEEELQSSTGSLPRCWSRKVDGRAAAAGGVTERGWVRAS